MKFLFALFFLFVIGLTSCERLDYRAKGVFSKEKTQGIERSVRGFGLPQNMRKRNKKIIPIIDDTSKKLDNDKLRKHIQRGIQIPNTISPTEKRFNDIIYSNNIDKLRDAIQPPKDMKKEIDENIYTKRKAWVLSVIIVTAIILAFVKFSKIRDAFTYSPEEISYRYKKYKLRSEKNSMKGDDEEEAASLLSFGKKSCKTT